MPTPQSIHAGQIITDSAVLRVLNGLRDQTLPAEEWTHGAHLCAGVGLIREVGLQKAEEEMPGFIRAFNVATGGENTDEAGYHQTLTLFYLRSIAKFFAGRWAEPVGKLATDLLSSNLAERGFPLQFFSKDLLFSKAARRNWVEPDLGSL